MTQFLVNNRASIWLGMVALILSATMMHPSFAALVCLALEAVAIFLMRWVAQIEGRVGRSVA